MSRVSIKHVAEMAGVSTATVSHVINETRFVREETRRRVLDVIDELNYQPSAIARGLATNATQTIALVISDITNPFFTAVARGVEDEVVQHGYHTIFCNTSEDASREDQYLRLLSARQIDGLVIASTGNRSERLQRMAEADIPIVLLDRDAPEITAPLVAVDNEGGAYQAVRYLIELGHRRIAVLAGPVVISTLKLRLDGYKRALREAGIPFDPNLVLHTDPLFYHNLPHAVISSPASGTVPGAHLILQQLFERPDPPTAIFITNNQMTLGALYALKNQGLRCPEDISIVSFDDHDWAALFSPPLTVIRQPTYDLGQTAAKVLMRMINGEQIEQPDPFPIELIVRESCREL